ncbi:MAG: matrixin family metalloprotease [Myxococcales bacterium]|nr:matrixin family metalloprotease [Myxococcales bacterium]MDH3486344.1 matrixin family metalloprotease [Myxococcales bacterium]
MNSRILLALAIGVASVAALTADHASAYCRMTTEGGVQIGEQACVENGEFLEWPVACLSYAIDERGSSSMEFNDVVQAIDSSFATWQNETCDGEPVDLIFKPLNSSTCRRTEFRNPGGNVNTIAFLDPWEDQCGIKFDENALAVTIVMFDPSNGRILDADMLINETLGPFASCPDSGCEPGTQSNLGPVDLQSIVTHEAGHFIGIGHSDVADATMFFQSPRTEVSKRTLAQDDIDAVCAIYPPGNLDASCTPQIINGLDLNCEDDGPPSCEPATIPSSGGCSAREVRPGETPWSALLVAMLTLTVLRRRSSPRDARS